MPNVQIEVSELHLHAYEIIARSHGMSRRAYMGEFLEKSAERVPGLMDKARSEMFNEPIKQDGEQDIRPFKKEGIKEPVEELYRWRFSYLDSTRGFIEGIGPSSGRAFMNATGRDTYIDSKDYEAEFRAPEMMGKVR